MRKMIMGLSLCAIGLLAAADVQTQPEIIAVPAERPPEIDGRLDDPCWSNVAADNINRLVGTGGLAGVATLLKLTHDADWLYLGLSCAEEKGKPIAAERRGRNNNGTTQDDSVEIFIDQAPGRDKHDYFHFMLGAGGAKREQRVVGTTQFPSWSVSWPSAVSVADGGWQVEIAIPLHIFSGDKIGDLGFNVTRNRRLDPQSYAMQAISWAPLSGTGRGAYYSPGSFGVLKGLTGLPVKRQCAPLIERAYDTTLFKEEQGAYSYSFRVDLSNPGGRAGESAVVVEDRELLSGVAVRHVFPVAVPAEGPTNYTFTVPARNPVERMVMAAIADEQARDEAWIEVAGVAALQSLTVYADLNYYSGEKRGRLTVGTVFSDAGFQARDLRLDLRITRADGSLFQSETFSKTHGQGVVYEYDPSTWAPGTYNVTVSLQDKTGKIWAARETSIRVEPPPPAGITVTKVDQQRMCMLLNGQPFFPIGFCNNAGFGMINVLDETTWQRAPEDFSKRCVDAGFNLLIHWSGARLGKRRSRAGDPWTTEMAKQLEADIDTNIKEYANAQKAGLFIMPQVLGHVSIPHNNPAIIRRDYDLVMAQMPGIIERYRKVPNLAAIQGRDEVSPEVLYEAIAHAAIMRKIDPYHVIFATCRGILPENYDAYDIFGVHAYWGPDTNPNRLASWILGGYQNAKSRRRPIFATPQGQRLEYRRELSPAERRCGIYAPLIQGAKGVFFFAISDYDTYHPVTWRVLSYTAREIGRLAPMLLENPPPQNVTFALAADGAPPALPPLPRPRSLFDPSSGSRAGARGPGAENMPVVQALIHELPGVGQGELILVANTGPAPLKMQYALSSLGNGSRVAGFFTKREYPVAGGCFTDVLEPFGVRVYRTDGGARARGAPVALGMQAVAGRLKPAADRQYYTPTDRTVQMGGYEQKEDEFIWSAVEDKEQILLNAGTPRKNYLENSSFEEYTLAGLPDNWIHSYSMRHLGINLFGQETNQVFEGRYSIRLRADAPNRPVFYPTISFRYWTGWKYDTDYVFSAYVKASRPDTPVRLAVLPDPPDRNYAETDGITHDFKIGTDWQRVEWTFRMRPGEQPKWPPAGKMLKPGIRVVPDKIEPPADVWVDAMQLEAGTIATPYERDDYRAPAVDPKWLSDEVFGEL